MVARPTEEYALARVTMLEKLNALSPYQKRVAILRAAGYTFWEQGLAFGNTRQNQGQQWRKALERLDRY